MLARGARQQIDKASAAVNEKLTSESRAGRGPGTSWEEEDISRVEKSSRLHSRPRSGSESLSRAQSSAGSSAMSRSQTHEHRILASTSTNTGLYEI